MFNKRKQFMALMCRTIKGTYFNPALVRYFTKPVSTMTHGIFVLFDNDREEPLAQPFDSTDEALEWLNKFFSENYIALGNLPKKEIKKQKASV